MLLTRDDVNRRAKQTLKRQFANGIQHVRGHIDIYDPTPNALKAMPEVKQKMASWVDIPQEGILCCPDGEALLELGLLPGADAIGAIPHGVFTYEYGVKWLPAGEYPFAGAF
ncbi:cytosine deaminase [Erwinia amylovora]|nr:cytosine deaminase [Erwinia amylovora]MBZ2401611.1 cytosine deaminase [Erwinia amylovora]